MARYTFDYKLSAVKQYLSSDKGYTLVCRELGMDDTKNLRTWVKQYKEGTLVDKNIKPRKVKSTPKVKKQIVSDEVSKRTLKAYNMQIKELELENAYLKKLYHLLMTKS